MEKIPVIIPSQLFHVGALNRGLKKDHSLEGEGLSVSTCPNEWRDIARLNGDTWKINNSNNLVLLDAHSLTSDDKSEMKQWAMSQGFIQKATQYQVEWFDDEMDDDLTALYSDKGDAQEESENMGVEYTEVETYISTDKFPDSTVSQGMGEIEIEDILVTIYANHHYPELHGVWWNDNMDPIRLSAPRGVIYNNHIQNLEFVRID